MTQHRNIDYGQRLPEALLDAFQEEIGSYVSPNFRLTKASASSLQVVAGTDNDQVAIAVDGRWRWITSTVNAAHPGGVAGTYDVYVTASDNNFVAGSPETDLTVYAFGLAIRPLATPPATALYRKVGTIAWDGASITAISPVTGDLGSAVVLVPDSQIRNRVTTTGAITNVITAGRTGDAADRVTLSEGGLTAGPGSGAQDVSFTRDATGPRWTSTVPVNASALQVGGVLLAASHLSNGVTGSGAVALAVGPTFTGTPVAPTAAAGTSTTQLATTAFVLGQGANSNPLVAGVAAQGSSDRYARQDHVHPSQYGAGILLDFAGLEANIPANTCPADGRSLSTVTFAIAYARIGNIWDTFGGLGAPGAGLFRVPDLRGRGTIGKNNMGVGTAPTIVGNYVARGAGATLASLIGEEFHTLTLPETPSHDHGGVTGNQSADHTHSGTTSTESADHTHTVPDHAHSIQNFNDVPNMGCSLAANRTADNTGGVSSNLGGAALTTSGRSAAHTHTVTTGGVSANHTHTITAAGGGGSHENVFPVAVVNKVMTLV